MWIAPVLGGPVGKAPVVRLWSFVDPARVSAGQEVEFVLCHHPASVSHCEARESDFAQTESRMHTG